jgi:hypothetical protein
MSTMVLFTRRGPALLLASVLLVTAVASRVSYAQLGQAGEMQEAVPAGEAAAAPQPAQQEMPVQKVPPQPPAYIQRVQVPAQAQQAAAPVPEAVPREPEMPTEEVVETHETQILQRLRNEPNIAVYAFGAKDTAINRALATRLVIALERTGRYQVSEGYKEFFDRAAEEWGDSALSVNSERFRGFARRFGADYVCMAEIVTVFGEHRVFVYILETETGEVKAKGASDVPLKALQDLTAASKQIAESMFKKKAPALKTAAAPPPLTLQRPCSQEQSPAVQQCPPCKESATVADAPRRRFKTGFALGYGFSGNVNIFQFGGVHIHKITENAVSLTAGVNAWIGEWRNGGGFYSSDKISFYGVNIPVLFRLESSAFFWEAGAFADVLSGQNEWMSDGVWITNLGAAAGGGLAFNKGYTQYFYRFNYGTAYYSHAVGIRQLF